MLSFFQNKKDRTDTGENINDKITKLKEIIKPILQENKQSICKKITIKKIENLIHGNKNSNEELDDALRFFLNKEQFDKDYEKLEKILEQLDKVNILFCEKKDKECYEEIDKLAKININLYTRSPTITYIIDYEEFENNDKIIKTKDVSNIHTIIKSMKEKLEQKITNINETIKKYENISFDFDLDKIDNNTSSVFPNSEQLYNYLVFIEQLLLPTNYIISETIKENKNEYIVVNNLFGSQNLKNDTKMKITKKEKKCIDGTDSITCKVGDDNGNVILYKYTLELQTANFVITNKINIDDNDFIIVKSTQSGGKKSRKSRHKKSRKLRNKKSRKNSGSRH